MAEPSKSKKHHYTYLILNITNDMKYVGARSCSCLPKLDTKYMGTSDTLTAAIKEEGREHFIKIILVEFPTRKLALMHEVALHEKYNVNKKPTFYNKAKQISKGFDFQAYGPDNHMYGKHLTEETKEKLSKKLKGKPSAFKGKHHTKEAKEKLSEKKKGKPSTFKGKHHTEEAKEKMSLAKKGKPGKKHTQEEKEKISKGNIGKKRTEESKKKMSKAQTGRYVGEKSPRYGKHHSEKSKQLISETKKREGSNAGTKNSAAKLTNNEILDLRYLYDIGTPLKLLRKEFGITNAQIRNIGIRKAWSHIPEEISPIDSEWQKNYCC